MPDPNEIIRIIFTEDDVRDIADQYNAEHQGACILYAEDMDSEDDCSTHDHEPSDAVYLTHEVALARAYEWAKSIQDSATARCNETLESVITLGTP